MSWHRWQYTIAFAGLAFVLVGCASVAPREAIGQLFNRSDRNAPADQEASLAARPEAHATGLSPERKKAGTAGLMAKILPASWFVEEGQSPEELSKSKAHIQYKLGLALEHKGQLYAAEEAFEEAVRLEPEYVPALLALARVYQRTGRPDTALDLYDRLLDIAPDDPRVWNNRGLCLQELGDLTEAESCLRKAVELDPMRALYRNNLAVVLAKLGYEEEAWEQFRQAVGPALAHYNLAVLAWQEGDRDRAKKHLQQALALDPNLKKAEELQREIDSSTVSPSPVVQPVGLQSVDEPSELVGSPKARVLGVRPAY